MPKNLTTEQRLLAALRKEERRRRKARRDPRTIVWRDLDDPPSDDPEGGAGVREPRRPWPTMPAAALELEEPEPQYLDLEPEPRYLDAARLP